MYFWTVDTAKPTSGLLTHSLDREVEGKLRGQCSRGLTLQVNDPHTACTGRELVGGG